MKSSFAALLRLLVVLALSVAGCLVASAVPEGASAAPRTLGYNYDSQEPLSFQTHVWLTAAAPGKTGFRTSVALGQRPYSDAASGFAAEDSGVVIRSDTSHIFREAEGHLAQDTAENRALLQGAVKPGNLVGTRGPDGSISVYRQTLQDGRQVWVEVRNGTEITNGGVNDVPR